MSNAFHDIIATFEHKLAQLGAMPHCDPLGVPTDAPTAGVYVLYEHGKPLSLVERTGYGSASAITVDQVRPTRWPHLRFEWLGSKPATFRLAIR